MVWAFLLGLAAAYQPSATLAPLRTATRRAPVPHLLADPHPLVTALRSASTRTPSYGGDPPNVGERVLCQVVDESPLGLNVATLPDGTPGLVYNDEAGFVPDHSTEPVVVGDVVCAWVLKVREDGRLDLAFRPSGAKPKLDGAASALLEMLFDAREAAGRGEGDGSVPLGDASSPSAIKLALGVSKTSFKAARGQLLKAGLSPFNNRWAEPYNFTPDQVREI